MASSPDFSARPDGAHRQWRSTETLDDRVRGAPKFLQSFIAGEDAVRTYQGEEKALVCWRRYSDQHMMRAIAR